MKEKIAIVVDSGSDINPQAQEKYNIISLPLRVMIDDQEFIDGVNISREALFAQIDTAKISTSLPAGEDIIQTFENLKEEAYTHVIVIAISSGLSGTFNVIQNLTQEVEGLEFFVLDTKNISLASGYHAIKASQMRDENKSFLEITETLSNTLDKSKVFFTVGTLDYLIKGGRIGLVSGTIASALNIKPVISCNVDGVYHTVSKVRGYSRVIHKMINEAYDFVKDAKSYRISLLNANSEENLDEILALMSEKFTHAKTVELSNITPALAIHTGPEAMGIAVYFDA